MRRLVFILAVLAVIMVLACASYAAASYVMIAPASLEVTVHPLPTPPSFEWGPGW